MEKEYIEKLYEAMNFLLKMPEILEENIEMAKELDDKNKYKTFTKEKQTYETIYDYLKTLENKLEKKDKMIDLMADWIFDKDYSENSLLIHRDDYYSNCINQVKQYFEKQIVE